MNSIKKQNSISTDTRQKLDIGFLYASPLISILKGSKQTSITVPKPLNFEKEKETLKKVLLESKKTFKIKSMVATKKNFREIMKLEPRILHISCRGNTSDTGDYLAFE